MTIAEACERFNLCRAKVEYYEENDLLCGTEMNGVTDYTESEIQNVSVINFLFDTGFTLEEVKRYMRLLRNGNGEDERIAMLRKYRYKLLDETHDKQKMIDRIDYTIHEIKK